MLEERDGFRVWNMHFGTPHLLVRFFFYKATNLVRHPLSPIVFSPHEEKDSEPGWRAIPKIRKRSPCGLTEKVDVLPIPKKDRMVDNQTNVE